VSRETYLIRLFFIGIMKASFPTYNPRIDNPTPHKIPEGDNAAPLEVIGACAQDKLIIIMVGLPGEISILQSIMYQPVHTVLIEPNIDIFFIC
jgi:hypothetical protein